MQPKKISTPTFARRYMAKETCHLRQHVRTHMNCYTIATQQEIAALFDRRNASLQTCDAEKVVNNYAEDSILLPTISNTPRLTRAEKEDYFRAFLENKPSSTIDIRHIEIGGNIASDSGIYTFTYNTTGMKIKARYSFTYRWNVTQWLITSHHSSFMPES